MDGRMGGVPDSLLAHSWKIGWKSGWGDSSLVPTPREREEEASTDSADHGTTSVRL